MKIGVLIDRLNVGGVEKSAIQEVRAMKSLGVDATLLVLSRKAVVKGAHSDLLKGINVEYLDDRLPKLLKVTFKFPMFALFSFFHLSYALFLPLFVKSSDFDYIVSHGSYTSLTALTLRKIKKIPYSIYFWDPISFILKRVYRSKINAFMLKIMDFFARIVDKVLVANSDYVFVAGDTHNDYFINECNVNENKIVTVNPGTPIGKPTKNKGDHVLMVTTWKEGKRPEYIFGGALILGAMILYCLYMSEKKKTLKKSKKEYEVWHKVREKDNFMEETEYYKVLGALVKGKKSVDIGCGYGSISMFSPEAVGVDFSDEALRIAKRNGVKHLVKASAEKLPFQDDEFEVSISLGTLEHVSNIKKAISEMVRISEIQIIIVHAALPFGIEYFRKPLMKIFGLKDQPIERPQKLSDMKRMLKDNGSRAIIEGVWNYIDLRWINKRIPYGILKWPSHHFIIAIKTDNLDRKFLKDVNLAKKGLV